MTRKFKSIILRENKNKMCLVQSFTCSRTHIFDGVAIQAQEISLSFRLLFVLKYVPKFDVKALVNLRKMIIVLLCFFTNGKVIR